jgi:hypothetical protein
MKKIILAIAAIALSVNVFADAKSEALLAGLSKKVASWGDYRVEFAISIDGPSIAGSYEVSGASYHVVTPDVELFCDGKTRWEVNKLDREVAIDRVDPADRTVMGNPTRLFDFLDGSYTHRYVGTALINGVNCQRIELKETALNAGSSSNTSGASGGSGQTIDVYLATATGLPVRVGYTIGIMNMNASIDVVRVTPHVTLNRTTFTYNSARYVGYEIVDFR